MKRFGGISHAYSAGRLRGSQPFVNHTRSPFPGFGLKLDTLPRAKGSRWDAGALCISGGGTDYAAERPRQHLLTTKRHGVLNRAEPA
jgi:hypothetical protein